MTALDLLKIALTRLGRNLSVTSASTIPGTSLITEALSLLGMDMTDTSFNTQAIFHINRMLIDLFEVNNENLELNGGTPLSSYFSISTVSDAITYQTEIVRNVMTYGLARDIGMATDNANTAYFAQMYDKQKDFYTLTPNGSFVKTVVPSVNEMLVDLFGINNDLRVSSGGATLASIPEITALGDTLTYQPALLKSVMPYGLARDLAASENNKQMMYWAGMYDKARDKAAIFMPVDITDEYNDSDLED